jgi:hypothetical protein
MVYVEVLSSIDHLLYRNLNLLEEESWVEGSLSFKGIDKLVEKIYGKNKGSDEYERDQANVKISSDGKSDSIKTYNIHLNDITGDQKMIHGGREILNPSDHLPMYVKFAKPIKKSLSFFNPPVLGMPKPKPKPKPSNLTIAFTQDFSALAKKPEPKTPDAKTPDAKTLEPFNTLQHVPLGGLSLFEALRSTN